LYSSEIVCFAVPTAGIGALLLFILVHIGKLPPPDPATVEEILGQDPLLQERDDSKKGSEGEKYIMRSIAHRGAALDAPENSISAFRQVRFKQRTRLPELISDYVNTSSIGPKNVRINSFMLKLLVLSRQTCMYPCHIYAAITRIVIRL
jgi:hypothetical protein